MKPIGVKHIGFGDAFAAAFTFFFDLFSTASAAAALDSNVVIGCVVAVAVAHALWN